MIGVRMRDHDGVQVSNAVTAKKWNQHAITGIVIFLKRPGIDEHTPFGKFQKRGIALSDVKKRHAQFGSGGPCALPNKNVEHEQAGDEQITSRQWRAPPFHYSCNG